MLQRTPTYMVSLPAEDKLANWGRKNLPRHFAYDLTRLRKILFQQFFFRVARNKPEQTRERLLGLIREVSRLPPTVGERFQSELRPLVDRAVTYLHKEMDRGRIRQTDPRLIAGLCYATVTGIATEPEVLRSVGWQPTTAELRRLRTELLAFLRAALTPG